jgi:hypothetical protein
MAWNVSQAVVAGRTAMAVKISVQGEEVSTQLTTVIINFVTMDDHARVAVLTLAPHPVSLVTADAIQIDTQREMEAQPAAEVMQRPVDAVVSAIIDSVDARARRAAPVATRVLIPFRHATCAASVFRTSSAALRQRNWVTKGGSLD